jgi:hypothetical protein
MTHACATSPNPSSQFLTTPHVRAAAAPAMLIVALLRAEPLNANASRFVSLHRYRRPVS